VGSTWTPNTPSTAEVKGWGGTEAPRGALMHQVTINGGKITKYQCIVPTTWNGSPKDTAGNRGAIEQACIGAPFDDATKDIKSQDGSALIVHGGVEILRIAQSFDPCIACAIH
jgi:hydrogenase large subunit